MFNIVLVEPEIPQNTGNIVRTAAATGCTVHLVKPLGFDISDRALKRAGLDYWHFADFKVYDSLGDFFEKNAQGRYKSVGGAYAGGSAYAVTAEGARPAFWFLSTKAAKAHTEATFRPGDYLVFGKETKGLPEDLLAVNYQNTIRIPMRAEARSLNLSNSVAITVYEALRQNGFGTLCAEGHLTSREE